MADVTLIGREPTQADEVRLVIGDVEIVILEEVRGRTAMIQVFTGRGDADVTLRIGEIGTTLDLHSGSPHRLLVRDVAKQVVFDSAEVTQSAS